MTASAAPPRTPGPAGPVPAGPAPAEPLPTEPAPAEAAPARPVPLRRNLQFQALWAGQAASSLGLNVANIAYPLAILALTGSPARAGLFASLQTVGMLAGGLPAGHLADRLDRRAVVIATESARALITAGVAVGLMLGAMTLPTLLIAAVLLGAGQAISGAARMPLVRSVVPPEQLTTALVQDEVRQDGAALAGPPLAGVLYGLQALEHAVPFLFTAVSFVLSMLAAIAMKVLPGADRDARPRLDETAEPGRAEPDPADPDRADPDRADPDSAAESSQRDSAAATGGRDGGVLAGIRMLWASPVLRAAMVLIMIVNAIGAGLDLAIIVILRGQHVHSGLIGVVLAFAAVGGLAGAPLVRPLHRIRPGVLLLLACLADVPVLAAMAVRFGPWWVAGLLFLEYIPVPAMRVLVDVLILRQTPDEMRGRVVAAIMTLIGLGMPVGAAITGLLLQTLTAQTAVLILAGAQLLGVLYCARMRGLWRARWPQQQ
jgi:Major Facilitator Superfamily